MIERFSYFDRFGWWYAGIGLAMLALVFVIGVERYGAKNWIQIGGFAMQPSEFVKIIFVFFVAALLARSVQFVDVVKVSVAAAAHVLILVVQKDLGAALIFFITYVIVLYVASQNSLYFPRSDSPSARGNVDVSPSLSEKRPAWSAGRSSSRPSGTRSPRTVIWRPFSRSVARYTDWRRTAAGTSRQAACR